MKIFASAKCQNRSRPKRSRRRRRVFAVMFSEDDSTKTMEKRVNQSTDQARFATGKRRVTCKPYFYVEKYFRTENNWRLRKKNGIENTVDRRITRRDRSYIFFDTIVVVLSSEFKNVYFARIRLSTESCL